ncbi:hypothetical protein E2320_010512 [Naja naja]|nr:hypothetical protein E2320_010512 [Naja naja]
MLLFQCSQFLKEKHVMDSSPEKLKKELEEELQMSSDDLRSHAWYHGRIPRQVSESLVQRDGDFLIRDSLSSPGNFVLTCQWKNISQHFKINKTILRLSEAHCRAQFHFEDEGFDTIPGLVRCYVGNRKPISKQSGAIIFQPINRMVPLRCLEEKYGVSPVLPREDSIPEGQVETPQRLSLHMCNRQARESTLAKGNLLRSETEPKETKKKVVASPHVWIACRRSDFLKDSSIRKLSANSWDVNGESSRYPSQGTETENSSCTKSPAFRTGSEPNLSPLVFRRFASEMHISDALRGSDSQLHLRPPPKPSKLPFLRPLQGLDVLYGELNAALPTEGRPTKQPLCPTDSFVEHLTMKDNGTHSSLILDDSDSLLSSVDPHTAQLEISKEGPLFVTPAIEKVSGFRPNHFESKLLPLENKPLETTMLKRVKELFVNNDAKVIAQHILKMDCKVARILEVSEETRRIMGVKSGLELITLPYGHQLRLDLIERHTTMAIGIAVDILGCTGNLEERVATLNRIIQVAVELKDSMGDLYAFSAIMKALEMPQIARLEQTWTSLRHCYTQTAIMYEKQLKPFSKLLHEGKEITCVSQNVVTVPLLMPLVTLLERQTVVFEGMDVWENTDQSCDIMLKHLATARLIAQNAEQYSANAERILAGFQPDDAMNEIFKTEFQMRLLWGSKGAQVNQNERYEKFNQILTALSRKLEPLLTKQIEHRNA